MAAGAASSDGLLRAVFDGCISHDAGIKRRPYHRNCSCALHKLRGHCSHLAGNKNAVSYPIRRSWSEGCLALATGAGAGASPCSSPVATAENMAGMRSNNSCPVFSIGDEDVSSSD
nr:uncharacterized protein LOC109177774 [Ipomoea batatas]GMD80163.1 uncharacterized protein LOC109177774 [Ipomoea batatas]